MKLYQLLFVIAFVHASLAASVHKEVKGEEHHVFTSELVDAFEITVPKSLLDHETQDDDDSDVNEQNDVKISPAIYEGDSSKVFKSSLFREDQVPVAIISDPVDKINSKQVKEEPKNVIVQESNKVEVFVKDPSEKDKKNTKSEETTTQKENKQDHTENEVPSTNNENKVPLKDEKPSKTNENEKPPKLNENESIKKPVAHEEVKPVKNCDKNNSDTQTSDKDTSEKPKNATPLEDEPLKQSTVTDEPPKDTPVNPIQQGIASIQTGLQNFGQNIVSLFRPPPSNDTSPPPNIFQNIQQTLQNIVRPPTPVQSDDVATPSPGIIQQGIQSFQQTIQSGINNLTQSFQNFINRPASDPVNADADASTTTSPTILQQAVTNLQQGVQQGLSNLNTTIQGLFRPQTRPAIIQTGLTNFQEGVQNISTGLQTLFATPQNGSDVTTPNLIQQSIQNLSIGLQNGVDRVNQTIQNVISPVLTTGPTLAPAIPQGIGIIRDGIQNAINRTIAQVFQVILSTSTEAAQSTTAAKEEEDENNAIQNRFREELEELNNTLHDGIKNITGYIDDIESNEAVSTTNLSTPIAVENVTPKQDKKKADEKNNNAEENTIDHKIVKHD